MKTLRELAPYKAPTHKEKELGTPQRTKFFMKRTAGQERGVQAFSDSLDSDGRTESLDEISKTTVLSYINKAQDKSRYFDKPERLDSRLKSFVTAQRKSGQSKLRPKVMATNEVSQAGIDAMRKMISDKSTPHHEREAARAKLHTLGHIETPSPSREGAWWDKPFTKTHPTPSAKKTTRRAKPQVDPEDSSRYYKYAGDRHYKYTGDSSTDEHTVHHYKDHRGHKLELHRDKNHIVNHWYHVSPKHQATKGKGFSQFADHIDKTSSYNFKENINEWAERKPHFNIGINSLKNITKNSETGHARFSIENNKLHGGDAMHFNHDDLVPKWGDHPVINGYISHNPNIDEFHYSAYTNKGYGKFEREDNHPILNKMREHGINKGILSNSGRVRPFKSHEETNHFQIMEAKQLSEIFDTHYPYEKVVNRNDHPNMHNYKFKSPHEKYNVEIYHQDSYAPDTASVNFQTHLGHMGKTGQEGKNSHKVLATVHHIVKQHIKEHPHIKNISFSAVKGYDEKGNPSSRTNLYDRITKNRGTVDKHSDFHSYTIPVNDTIPEAHLLGDYHVKKNIEKIDNAPRYTVHHNGQQIGYATFE